MGAPTPFFLAGPNLLLSLLGLLSRVDKDPPRDWRDAAIDVVIPCHNEEATLVFCLESLFAQTLQPTRIVVLDDGSHDRTRQVAEAYAAARGRAIEVQRVESSRGKTPGVKRSARGLDGDVLFVLDGDTVLREPEYIERAVAALWNADDVASACGGVLPLRRIDRDARVARPEARAFYAAHAGLPHVKQRGRGAFFLHEYVNLYRDFLYSFLRSLTYRSQMALFGTIVNPVGCAVAYRRACLRDVFDAYEDRLGDNLTTSEDIFLGFAFLNRGYRNVLVDGIFALSEEPFLQRLLRQTFLWSSSFFQSCYYFPELVVSPFKALRRRRLRRQGGAAGHGPAGAAHTAQYGRPIGWSILFGLIEKISLPVVVLIFVLMRDWRLLALTLTIEMAGVILIVTCLGEMHRGPGRIWKAAAATPLRYVVMLFDLVVVLRFATDVWVVRDFNWRK
jgi:glycosyltransferase involved in cell wall biosynthesis